MSLFRPMETGPFSVRRSDFRRFQAADRGPLGPSGELRPRPRQAKSGTNQLTGGTEMYVLGCGRAH
eukprot:123237-Alexandrium_andersonii.AAC.1